MEEKIEQMKADNARHVARIEAHFGIDSPEAEEARKCANERLVAKVKLIRWMSGRTH